MSCLILLLEYNIISLMTLKVMHWKVKLSLMFDGWLIGRWPNISKCNGWMESIEYRQWKRYVADYRPQLKEYRFKLHWYDFLSNNIKTAPPHQDLFQSFRESTYLFTVVFFPNMRDFSLCFCVQCFPKP